MDGTAQLEPLALSTGDMPTLVMADAMDICCGTLNPTVVAISYSQGTP